MNKKIIITLLLIYSLLTEKLLAQDIGTITPVNNEVNEISLRPFTTAISGTSLTSNSTLNTFFATKISTYLSQATDLSLSKAYAVLDNTDGRLFLGGTFNAKQNLSGLQRLLFTGGIKANVKDGFANLFGTDGINNDIGLSFKATIFGRGTIWFDKNTTTQKDKVTNKRIQIVNELLGDFDNDLTKFKRNQTALPGATSAINSYITEYENEMRTNFTKKEADFINKKKLFNLAHTWWVGFDLYIPVSESNYKTVTNFSTTTINSTVYRPYEFNITYTNFWEKNKWTKNVLLGKGTTLFTLKGYLTANNSVNASLIDGFSFDKYLTQTTVSDTSFLAKLDSKTVYVGKYESFITPKFSARYVYMPLEFIGLSAAFEKSFGKIDNSNWRLGIPISLKDNEGKSKINFELVWREISKEHSFGLSVGLPIGGTIF